MTQIARGALCTGVAMMVIAAAAGCKQIPPPTPLSELNPQQVRGYQVYQAHCVQCHNDRSNQPLNGPALRGIFKKQYLNSGAPANDERVMDAVLLGRPMMPPMGNQLTPQDREDLLAYLHTL
jgi:mono/diheme cytochrome c family protein